MNRSALLFTVPLLLTSSLLWAHSGATGVVKVRMDNFDESKASMKVLKKAVRNKEFKVVAREAESIHRWAEKLTGHFPEGSNPPPSEALDLIWKEFERFEQRASDQIKASDKLYKAGLAEDAQGVAKAFSALAKTCKACHDDYRE